jgi:hypothetical protein
MSVDLNVFLVRSSMPAPAEWTSAITDAGFDAQLDSDFDVDTFTGFLPCTYKGEPAGFEYYADALDADGRATLQLPDEFDFAVTFVTGSNMREFITSLIASGVLCQLSGGAFFDPQSGEFTPADSVSEMLRSEVAECEKHL